MRKKLLLSIGFSLGATALTAVTVGWMGRPQEQALLSPMTESERAQVVESLRADRSGRGRQKMMHQILEMLEEQDPERLAWQEVQALRSDLEHAREQLRQAELQHSTSLRQLRGEYTALREERDRHEARVAHLERMTSLLAEQVRTKVSELERLQLASQIKEASLQEGLSVGHSEIEKSRQHLAELQDHLALAQTQLTHQESIARQREEDLRELRIQHGALALAEAEKSEKLAEAENQKRRMQRQAWMHQEALSSLRDETGRLEGQLTALREQHEAQRLELGEFQSALSQAIADRGSLQRQLLVAKQAVLQAEELAALPVSQIDPDWLMRLTETQMVLQGALSQFDGASSPLPIAAALHQTLLGLKASSIKLAEASEAKRQADEDLALSRQRVQTLEQELAASASLRTELQHLAQQHAQIAASIGTRGQSEDRLIQTASSAPLTQWLTKTQQVLDQVPVTQEGVCSRASCLKAEMEGFASKVGQDWQPLAACCSRWAAEVSALSEELDAAFAAQAAQVKLAQAENLAGDQQSQDASQHLLGQGASMKRRTARARRQVEQLQVTADEQAQSVEDLEDSVAGAQTRALDAQERILQLETQLAAKSEAAVALAERVAALETSLEERRANLASVTDQLVELEHLREQEAMELTQARLTQRQSSEQSTQQATIQQRQLAEALSDLAQQREIVDSLRQDYATLQKTHDQALEAHRHLVAQQQAHQAAELEILQLANEGLRQQLAAVEAHVTGSADQAQTRAAEIAQLQQKIAQLETDHEQRVRAWEEAEEARLAAVEAVKSAEHAHLHQTLSLRAEELDGLQLQLEQERALLAEVRAQLAAQETSAADLKHQVAELEQQCQSLSQEVIAQNQMALRSAAERDEALQAAAKAQADFDFSGTSLAAAQQENEALTAQLHHLQALRMDVRLAEVRQELFELKKSSQLQEAQLSSASRTGLELQEALTQMAQKQASLLAAQTNLEHERDHWKQLAEQAETAAQQAEQSRSELAARLQQWEDQQLPLRLQEALSQLDELELDLAQSTQGGHQQAVRLEQLEKLVERHKAVHAEELAHQQRIAAELEEQIATLQQTVQERGREILLAQSAKADRLMELESGIAAREAEASALKRDLTRVQQELAGLKEANWEARARQLEGQAEVLITQAQQVEEQKASLQRTCESLREELAAAHLANGQTETLVASLRAEAIAQLQDEQQKAQRNLQTLQEALTAQQERVAMAESLALQRELALQGLDREKRALEEGLARRFEEEWSARLADAQHELQMTRNQLAQAQEDRQSRTALIEQMESRFQAALVAEAQRHNELELTFQKKVSDLERQSESERSSYHQKMADLQQALQQAETVQQKQQEELFSRQTQLENAQQRLDQAALAQQEQERLRKEESHSAKERALSLEGRYQTIVATLRSEQDQRLAKVSELENQVALRDSQMDHQLKSLERAHSLLDETRSQAVQLAARLHDVEAQLASTQQQALSATATAQTLRSALDQREQQVAALSQESQTQARLAERSDQMRQELEEQLRISRGREQDLMSAQTRLSDQSKGEVVRLQEMLETMRRQIADREAERQELRSELLAAQEQLSHLAKARRDLQASMADHGGRAELLQQQIDRLQVMLREGQLVREDQADQISSLRRELEHRQALLDEEDQKHRALEVALLQEKNQVTLLEGRLNALSGQDAEELVTVPQQGRFHLVRQGETLRDIAKRYYGDQREMFRLRTVNQKVLGDRDEPASGQLLVIP